MGMTGAGWLADVATESSRRAAEAAEAAKRRLKESGIEAMIDASVRRARRITLEVMDARSARKALLDGRD